MSTVVYMRGRTGDDSWEGERRTLGEEYRGGLCAHLQPIRFCHTAKSRNVASGLIARDQVVGEEKCAGLPPRSVVDRQLAATADRSFHRAQTTVANAVHEIGGSRIREIETVARRVLYDAVLTGDRRTMEVAQAVLIFVCEVSPREVHDRAVAILSE